MLCWRVNCASCCASPSTRRAWIEIEYTVSGKGRYPVALHPEGVDRNIFSPSSSIAKAVALHPEGVDRNDDPDAELRCFAVALHPEGVDRNSPPPSKPR